MGTEDSLEQAIGAAVEVGRGHDLVAVVQEREHRGRGGQARGERQGRLSSLERGQAGLECRAGRVAAARVLVALVPAWCFLGEGGRGVDRHDRRPGRRVGVLAGVDGPRGKAWFLSAWLMAPSSRRKFGRSGIKPRGAPGRGSPGACSTGSSSAPGRYG